MYRTITILLFAFVASNIILGQEDHATKRKLMVDTQIKAREYAILLHSMPC